MTANVYYDDVKKCFVMYYQGKRYERNTLDAMGELVTDAMKDMRLESLYA